MPPPRRRRWLLRSGLRCRVARAISRSVLLACSLLLPSLAAGQPLEEGAPEQPSIWSDVRWKFSTGFDYSTGDYGLDEDTELLYVPLSVEADFFPVRFKLTLPLISLDGPAAVLIDGPSAGTGRTTGLGQIITGVGYLWVPPSEAIPYVEGVFKVTAPTETSDDLGAGEWGFALQADVFKRFGPVLGFGTFGRKFYTGSVLDDRFYTSVGASFEVNDWIQLGLAYDWFEASVDSVRDTHQLSPFAGFELAKDWSFGPYGLIGLSQGAPDWGVGFALSLRR